ncbi:DALR anticodon-binding domain-containing protein 3-like [Polyodon spathula]|uniref:DALR anticodon-binding domain-containing protein 3-like n=1 Tax=Polyodon spathula TaxID=7913 RepID=UPI001B7F4FBD|nr:DALR anticodon-binding domain-containing protein 3-like [Polyodon spathula]
MDNPEDSAFRISSTVRALSSALRGESRSAAGSEAPEVGVGSSSVRGGCPWFKESSAKNLRSRDFIAPSAVLNKLFPDGQVPEEAVQEVMSVQGGGVLPVQSCVEGRAGLQVLVDRPAVFQKVLDGFPCYLRPGWPQAGEGRGVLLNCTALQGAPVRPEELTLSHLRALLITDHLGELLRGQVYCVSLSPALEEHSDIITFLNQLGVDWPTVPAGWSNREREAELWEALRSSVYTERGEGETGMERREKRQTGRGTREGEEEAQAVKETGGEGAEETGRGREVSREAGGDAERHARGEGAEETGRGRKVSREAGGDAERHARGEGAEEAGGDAERETRGEGAEEAGGDAERETRGEGAEEAGGDAERETRGEGAEEAGGDAERETRGEGAEEAGGDAERETSGEGAEETGRGREVSREAGGDAERHARGEGAEEAGGDAERHARGEGAEVAGGDAERQARGEGAEEAGGDAERQARGEGAEEAGGDAERQARGEGAEVAGGDAERQARGEARKQSGRAARVRVNLGRLVKERGLLGFDPNLGSCLVQERCVAHLAELQGALSRCEAGLCTALHVVCCEDEFQLQQTDLLWRITGLGGKTVVQRHLVVGPVTVTGLESRTSASQYLQLRGAQMRDASVMKYGPQVNGESWNYMIKVMTLAAVRFELLTTAHRCPVTLDLRKESSFCTKGSHSGVFVMYNCARLSTLFQSYQDSVQQGLYPEFPEAAQLEVAALREEGEWQLLFNYIIPFGELLDQSGQTLRSSTGVRITLGTEAVCKFLVSLSMDFSSYYNRVHILGEPLPHLFSQMFARLQLMRGVRELLHCALGTLHIPPLHQI